VEASVLCLGDSLCMQFRLIDIHLLLILHPVFQEQGMQAVIRDRIRINEEVLAAGGNISFSGQAGRYLITGDFDKAMDYYELALDGEDMGLLSYLSLANLQFPEIKSNPRYPAILDRMNLPRPE
jgi:hypothetical protein